MNNQYETSNLKPTSEPGAEPLSNGADSRHRVLRCQLSLKEIPQAWEAFTMGILGGHRVIPT